MDDLDKMARELLAAEFDAADSTKRGEQVRAGTDNAPIVEYAIAAIRTALLAAPPGYVLVPVEPGDDQLMWMDGHDEASQRRAYANLLAASPRATQP